MWRSLQGSSKQRSEMQRSAASFANNRIGDVARIISATAVRCSSLRFACHIRQHLFLRLVPDRTSSENKVLVSSRCASIFCVRVLHNQPATPRPARFLVHHHQLKSFERSCACAISLRSLCIGARARSTNCARCQCALQSSWWSALTCLCAHLQTSPTRAGARNTLASQMSSEALCA